MIYTSICAAWGNYYGDNFALAITAAVMCGCAFCMEIGIMVIMGQMEQNARVAPQS